MKKLLITGFEPFGKESVNPSWDAVNLLPSKVGEYALTKLCIPVIFGVGAERVLSLANELSPDVIMCVGQAGGRAFITPETVGINLRHADIPDNSGYRPIDEPIVKGGVDAHFSTIPVRKIAEALNSASIPSQVSYSAGTYVCNDLLYTLLSEYKNTDVKVGFIHVPYSKEQGKEPSMDILDIVKGLILAIQNLDI